MDVREQYAYNLIAAEYLVASLGKRCYIFQEQPERLVKYSILKVDVTGLSSMCRVVVDLIEQIKQVQYI